MKIKTFLQDSLLNIFSVALPLLVLQIITFPLIANELGGQEYGLIIALISLYTVVSFPLGNVLNNVRLLMNESYLKKKEVGDFNNFLAGSSFIGVIIINILSLYIDPNITKTDIILLSIITVLSLLKEYLIVGFRLILNYKGILLNNFYLSFGYLLGTFFFYLFGYWQLIYLFGLILSIVYILVNTKLHKEPFKFTSLLKETLNKSVLLYISNLLKNLISHADKLILLPLLGPTSVAVYYTATIIGKIISMLINPINSVILSYLVKMERISLKGFLKMFSAALMIGIFGYIASIFVSPFFLRFFYKEWSEQSLELIYITTATAIVGMLSTVINPFNLRFNKTILQIYMTVLHLIVYIISSYFFYTAYGLKGFSFGVLIAAIFQLLMQLSVFFFNYYRKKEL